MQRFTLHDRRRGQVPAQVEPGQLRFQPTDRSRRAATTEGLPLPLWIACRAYHSRSAGTSARRGDHCYAPRQLGSNLLHKFLGGPSRRRKAGCPREALGVLSPTHLTRSRTRTAGTDQFASPRPVQGRLQTATVFWSHVDRRRYLMRRVPMPATPQVDRTRAGRAVTP